MHFQPSIVLFLVIQQVGHDGLIVLNVFAERDSDGFTFLTLLVAMVRHSRLVAFTRRYRAGVERTQKDYHNEPSPQGGYLHGCHVCGSCGRSVLIHVLPGSYWCVSKRPWLLHLSEILAKTQATQTLAKPSFNMAASLCLCYGYDSNPHTTPAHGFATPQRRLSPC